MQVTSRSIPKSILIAIASLALLAVSCGEEEGTGAAPAISSTTSAVTADHVVPTGQACMPTGKHGEHEAYACATCHQCAGTVSFDPAVAGATATFNATTKSCSNVACHAVPAGSFTYTQWDWALDQPIYVSVPYGGESGSGANWYAPPGSSCSACHGYPPKYNGTAYTWHSGAHGLGISNGNACQLCHPDATGAYVYGGPPTYTGTSAGLILSCAPGTFCAVPGAITNAAKHGNGVLDVTPSWQNQCFGCH